MKKLNKFILLIILNPLSSFSTEIHEHHCVDSGVDKIYQLLTRYSDYTTMEGSKYSVNLAGAEVDLIQMIKSQSKLLISTQSQREDLVWLVLQPALINDAKLYPRFLLNCKVEQTGSTSFEQVCLLQKEKQHFGLSDLIIKIHANSSDLLCKTGNTGIKIDIEIQGNSIEIDQIKKATLGPAGILAPLVSTLFDEDAFFRSYFRNLYHHWTKSL